MRWLFDNPQLFLLIAGAVAYWLNQRRQAKEQQEMEQELRREPTDSEMAERTRRIQEEIRRKIEERLGQAPQTRPVRVETVRRVPPPMPEPPPLVVAEEAAPGAAEMERALQRLRDQAEELKRLEVSVGSGSLTATAVDRQADAAYALPSGASRSVRRTSGLLDGLQGREALRRAIVLREVLGPPKALQ